MKRDFLAAVEHRRSVYFIEGNLLTGRERVEEIVKHAVTHAPSTFNSQSARAVVLLEDAHRRLWDMVLEILRGIIKADDFGPTAKKVDGFRRGAGTVMFFEDRAVVDDLMTRYPLYADKFPEFSLEASGMLQFVVWTALEDEGYGASLQHYNPLIDDAVREEWNLPKSWQLRSQLVFGSVVEWAGEKSFTPIEQRVLVF
ncbi:MAG: nitroreductase family protein [Candidatus Chlorobium antarcticum]|nr:nitroreductase family protein [Candidatus Chlorobium antarcticum]